MKQQKTYEADDQMINIIRDNSNILQSLGSFGINLGFGNKTVAEVCESQNVDTYTFLTIVNFTINGYYNSHDSDRISVSTDTHDSIMKQQKTYEADDQMINIIRDNSNILQSLGSFGINLGFGNKTVAEVCESQNVDTYTFLTIVNFTINGYYNSHDSDRISVSTLLKYLKASHAYYIDFQLPFIRKELCDALDEHDNLAQLILQLYDEYAQDIVKHMRYEEKTVFPYVEQLLQGNVPENFDISTFSKHHDQVEDKLRELKNIIIKYLPSDDLRNNLLTATLYGLYNNEEWLSQHAMVVEQRFFPQIA